MKTTPASEMKEPRSQWDYACGLGSYYPKCLQPLATPRAFFVVYSMMGILQGAFKTYFFGVMSTLERRFGMSSKTTGAIILADNISAVFVNLIAGYYGNRISQPKILAVGVMTMMCSCFLSVLPFLVYGPGLHVSSSQPTGPEKLTDGALLCSSERPPGVCSAGSSTVSYFPFVCFFLSNFLFGAGGCTFFTIGVNYLDNNVRRKNSPLYLGMGMFFRLLGPFVGFVTASFCLRFYENPFQGSGLSSKDPRWIGAWWLGYVLCAAGLAVIALPMMLFPRILPSAESYGANRNCRAYGRRRASRDVAATLSRITRNRIFMLHAAASVFLFAGTLGYASSLSKYLEYHFRIPSSTASAYAGATNVLTEAVMLPLSALVMQLLRPRSTLVTSHVAIAESGRLVAFVLLLFMGCNNPAIHGVTPSVNSISSMTSACNVDCNCTTQTYEPVCSSDGTTSFFSPCHAGCNSVGISQDNLTVYRDCNCVDAVSSSNQTSFVTEGLCGQGCNTLSLFLAVLVVGQIVGPSARLGAMLVQLRCVDPKDKSMALGIVSASFTLFAFIPYPLVYGSILDSTCLVWEESCGSRGNCWLYDVEQLHFRLHLVTIGLVAVAVVFQVATACVNKGIANFYEDDLAPENVVDEATTTMMSGDTAKDTVF